MRKKRGLFLLLTSLAMISGLLSRKLAFLFPPIVNAYLGDGLWGLMIFFGCCFLWPPGQVRKPFFYGLSFCYIIEWSQLYHEPWIDRIRQTTVGGLVLGYGFLWSDLVAYTVGILVGASLVKWCPKNKKSLWSATRR